MTESIDLDPYIAFALRNTHASVLAWCGVERVRACIGAGLADQVERRTDPERAKAFRERCPVRDTDPKDYVLREIDLGPDGRALAGIHFAAMDRDRPFAGIAARTRPIETPEAAERIGRRLERELAAFAPESGWVWQGPLDVGLSRVDAARVDHFLIAAPVGEIRAASPPALPLDLDLELRPTTAEPIYDAYLDMYGRALAERPELAAVIHEESLESLQESAEVGGLVRVDAGRELAGLFASRPEREPPVDGWVMVDEVLDTPWRGRGLAAGLQRRFIDALPAADDAILYGHIGRPNLPSLRTALRVGRIEVGRWVFVPFS